MSDYLVHFTRGDSGAYTRMMGILGCGHLIAGQAFGAARSVQVVQESQRSVCFSEVPLGYLQRIVQRRSLYGLGFRKDYLATRGALPVWYAEQGTTAQVAVSRMVAEGRARGDAADPLWAITPFIDFPGAYGKSGYRFEWEREWRIPGDLRFSPNDVAFLFIAEADHLAARRFFADAEAENVGPNYPCPYIDPRWTVERVREVLEAEHERPPDDTDE